MRLNVLGRAFDGIGVTASADLEDDAKALFEGAALVSHPAKTNAPIERAVLSTSFEDNFIMGAP